MKITDAWVFDPTIDGVLKPPMLVVEVDTLPDVTIGPDTFSGGWTVSKYGPFVKYVQQDPGAMHKSPVNAGDFNVRFGGRFPSVLDVRVQTGDAATDQFSLPLNRARQLVRKHAHEWRLLLSDKAGQHGSLLWLPVQASPQCRWVTHPARTGLGREGNMSTDAQTCGYFPARYVTIDGVDIPLCPEHTQAHNTEQAVKRTASASK